MKLEHFGMAEPGDCRLVFTADAEELERAITAEQAAPDAPQAEEFESEEDFTAAQEEYGAEMAVFAEQTQQLEFDISEGRVRKYAVIGNLDIEFRYEEIEDEEREVMVNEGQDDEQGSEQNLHRVADIRQNADGAGDIARLRRDQVPCDIRQALIEHIYDHEHDQRGRQHGGKEQQNPHNGGIHPSGRGKLVCQHGFTPFCASGRS